ncbi:MAG: 23S rRNA (pseudouridine(1915)-N(3))-methyltransferase RlmH [Proteobacteria bacterium]|nr:23S rRNA (pseudouridine(1915)-N(3))-methyltransferase RlmH [Pseudomonadota bacterium]
MKVSLIAVGRLKSGPERQLCDRYAERFSATCRAIGVQDIRILELPESNQRRPDDRMAEEARTIAAALPESGLLITFDERGSSMTSPEFAARLRQEREAGTAALSLVIGGPDGLAPSLRQRAGLVLSFGRLTLPHQMVRALALEQLYRAATILTGHPYHRV